MKALRILLVLLLVLCISTAAADATWKVEAEYTSAGDSRALSGTLIPVEDYGKVIHLKNKVGGWVRITAPCDGDLHITILCKDIDRASFELPIHSDSRPGQVWPRFERSDKPQTYVFPDVKEGETVSWWAHKGNGWTYTDDFLMVVCFTGHHASAGDPSVCEATCTEAGYEITATCLYCSGDKAETSPALGHDWSEAGVARASTCTENGVYGMTCLRCGEFDVLYDLPVAGHEEGAPIVTRAATCTTPGTSEVRCTRCDALLYTLTTPCTDHAAQETASEPCYGAVITYDVCACGYRIGVREVRRCTHPNAVVSAQRESNLYVMDVSYCRDCDSTLETVRPTSTSLVNIILTGVCLLLLLTALILLVITLVTALRPLPAKKGATPPASDAAARSTEGRNA